MTYQWSKAVAVGLFAVACSSGGENGVVPIAQPGSDAANPQGSSAPPSAETPDIAGPRPAGCDAPSPGRSPLRRLNRSEYISTVGDLLGLQNAEELAGALPPDEQAGGFSNNADALVVTNLLAGYYISIAEALAAAALENPAALTGCTPADAEAICADRFVAEFGKRAFRRPLNADEHARYLGMFNGARLEAPFEESLGVVIRTLLQSPHFLYRVEVGVPAEPGATVVAVTPHELATRLSYALWGSMPDAELFSAADSGALLSVEQIDAQVRRMLTTDRARLSIARFHREWLTIDGVTAASKDPALFPEELWSAPLQSDLRAELETFVNEVFWTDGRVATLLGAPFSYLNANLASYYGVAAPAGQGFVRTELNPAERAGLLTSGGLMAFLAGSNQTSPVHRGKYVREKILCQELPAPPNDIVIEAPEVATDSTTRVRYERHATDPVCSGCHALMDPIGFGFENYDPTGRYRTMDGEFAVDPTGQVVGAGDADGPFANAVELAQRLAQSEAARDCVATQVFRYTVGRTERVEDTCSMAQLSFGFEAKDYDMRELWVAIATTDAFRYRALNGGGE